MSVDLGTYAAPVLGAYGVTLVLLAGLVAATVLRGRRVRRDLAQMEARRAAGATAEAEGRDG